VSRPAVAIWRQSVFVPCPLLNHDTVGSHAMSPAAAMTGSPVAFEDGASRVSDVATTAAATPSRVHLLRSSLRAVRSIVVIGRTGCMTTP
jgi:hypothetical protein